MHKRGRKAGRRMGLVAALAALALALPGLAAAQNDRPQVVELTQVACQFLEPEGGVDHGYTTHSKADCERINARTGADRLAQARTLVLEPGPTVFRVTNKDVPYALGFWVRGAGLVSRATLPSASGGGLTTGATQEYRIDLAPGEYVFSCPLNPTPDYRLIVRER